jgi:hypothetical protein
MKMKNSEQMFSGFKKPFEKFGEGVAGLEKMCEDMGGEFYSSPPDIGQKAKGQCLLRVPGVFMSVDEYKDGSSQVRLNGDSFGVYPKTGFDEIVCKKYPYGKGGILEGKKDGQVIFTSLCHNMKEDKPACTIETFDANYEGIFKE